MTFSSLVERFRSFRSFRLLLVFAGSLALYACGTTEHVPTITTAIAGVILAVVGYATARLKSSEQQEDWRKSMQKRLDTLYDRMETENEVLTRENEELKTESERSKGRIRELESENARIRTELRELEAEHGRTHDALARLEALNNSMAAQIRKLEAQLGLQEEAPG